MSLVQCLPGPRKNGQTMIRCAPRRTQLSYAVAIDGSAISMWAGSTMSYFFSNRCEQRCDFFEHLVALFAARAVIDNDDATLEHVLPYPFRSTSVASDSIFWLFRMKYIFT